MAHTLTYDESGKGWTSFHSFIPDWMQRINNRFFSVKDGQIYLHNDESSEVRNNFYGVQYPTTIKLIANEFPSEVKFAKTIMLEANKPFDVNIKSYLNDETEFITQTDLDESDFLDKEGMQYAYLRQSTLIGDYSAKNVYGLGRVGAVLGSEITMLTDVPLGSIAVGDDLITEFGISLGKIVSYEGNTITLDSLPIIAIGAFVAGYKNPKIEGSAIRGYNFEIDLTDETSTRTEIYGVNLGVAKSFP